jgi:hypothetical protein
MVDADSKTTGLLPRRRQPARDRRGSVAGILAVSATALIGMVALAAEAGVWHMQLRETRTAADLGALAGAAAIERNGDVQAVATTAVTRNGFATGAHGGRSTVTVSRPPVSGAYAGRSDAVEVVVSQAQNLGLASLVLSAAPTARSRAVAVSAADVRVCVLALDGGLILGGNSTVSARRCAIAANSAARGITVSGNARVRTKDLLTTGACTACDGGDVWTDDTRRERPTVIDHRANRIADPYAGLQAWTPAPPACRTTPIQFGPSNNRTMTIAPSEGAICNSLTVNGNETLNLEPGLYYFDRGASLDIRGTVRGSGVTIVLTGDTNNVGTLAINGTATVDLSGPVSSLIQDHPEAREMVFYRDARAANGGPSNEARLNGGSTMRINGAIYMPTTDITVNGNTGASSSTCMPVVGYSLSYSGNGDTTVDVSGCANAPVARTARLVE